MESRFDGGEAFLALLVIQERIGGQRVGGVEIAQALEGTLGFQRRGIGLDAKDVIRVGHDPPSGRGASSCWARHSTALAKGLCG